MTKLTPQELDERIEALKAVYDVTAHPDFVTDLRLIIRDCMETVRPSNAPGYYGYCGCDPGFEQDVKELLG